MRLRLSLLVFSLATLAWAVSRVHAEEGSALFHSDDDGRTWAMAAQRPPGQSIFCLTIDPQVPNRFLIGTDRGSWVLDAGVEWRPIPTLSEASAGAVFGFATSRSNERRLYAATEMGVFRSDDLGNQWQRLEGSPAGAISIAVGRHGEANEAVFVGTADGLFLSLDEGAQWQSDTTGLTGAAMAIAVGSNGETFVGTSNGAHFRASSNDDFALARGVQVGASRAAYVETDERAYVGVSSVLYLRANGWHRQTTLPLAGTGDPPGITAILPTNDGRLLVGTEKGLHSSDKWQLVPPFDSLSHLEIGAITRNPFVPGQIFATGSAIPHAVTLARVNVSFHSATAEADLGVISIALSLFFLLCGFMAIRFLNRSL